MHKLTCADDTTIAEVLITPIVDVEGVKVVEMVGLLADMDELVEMAEALSEGGAPIAAVVIVGGTREPVRLTAPAVAGEVGRGPESVMVVVKLMTSKSVCVTMTVVIRVLLPEPNA